MTETEREIPEGTVTVLFTDLVDSTQLNQTLGDDGARAVGRRIDEMARTVVSSHRGALIKEMGDGLMAAFASARRAVAAAQEIQVEMRRLQRDDLEFDAEMRIGLHTGEVIDEDGDIHGETVIIAKRIEGLAPAGGILVSETVHGVLGTARTELIEQGATELKGIDAEWRLYLVPVPDAATDDRTLADNEPTPYVGRVAERKQLRTMVEAASGGRGGVVLIGGPAGVGKTRLTREAATEARRLGMTVYTGHCVDMESPPPYQPSVDHLEQAARAASADGFRAALGENAPEVAKLLPSLRQRYDDIPPSPDLTPEQERRYMLHGVAQFIERAARNQPMLLTYEDLHWADESTMLMLRHMAGRVADVPLLLIGTYRDDELDPGRALTSSIGPLIRDGGAADLHPRLLTAAEVGAVLTARAGRPAPLELVDLFVAETQGNPYFVEELYRHLRDEGRLFDDDGEWRGGFAVGETEVPQGVRLIISRRLDQLAPEHRKALASAAVIGRTFAFGTLAAVSTLNDDQLFDVLEAAERAHLVEELPDAGDAWYLFAHEQIRQTLVGELSLARRQRIHLRIADVLAATVGTSPVDLAHHLLSSGPAAPPDRTVDALVAAATRNMEALAFEDALRPLRHAVELAAGARRLELRRLEATALRGAGRVDEALGVLNEELAIADEQSTKTALRLQRVQLLNDQYRAGEGLDDITELIAAAADADDPELDIAVQLMRGRSHYILSLDAPEHAAESREAYETAYVAAKAHGDRAGMARALLPTTWFTDYWADYGPTAKANVTEAKALALEIGDEDLRLEAESTEMHRGRNYDLEASHDLLARLEARRDPVKLNAHCFWLMWQHFVLGPLEDCVAMCDRGIELADLIGSAPVQYGGIKAIALTEMGRYDDVEAAIAQEVTDDDHPFGQAMASLARSVLLTRLCAWEPAAASLDDTLRRAEALSRVWMLSWAESLEAVVAARLEANENEAEGEPKNEHDVAGDGVTRVVTSSSREQSTAEVSLVHGRYQDAVDAASRFVQRRNATPTLQLAIGLETLARANLALGRLDAASKVGREGLELAERLGAGALVWRLRMVDSLATGESTETATSEFRALADRISDPELRSWFERQPLAPGSERDRY